MAITHSTAARNAAANAVVDLIDVGTTDATGDLVFMTAADADLASLALSDPAFGNAANGIATANAITSDTNASAGTATKFQLRNKDNVSILEGTAGTSGTDIVLSSNVFSAGDTVAQTSLTYTAPV